MSARDELNQANNRNGDLLTVISGLQKDNAALEKRIAELETKPDASARLIKALEQIIDNCECNDIPTSNHRMALRFIRDVAHKALHARTTDRNARRRTASELAERKRREECEAVLREVANAPNRIAHNSRIIADYFGEGN